MPAQEIDTRIGDMDGPEALPRSNGELVFEAPWEGRIFGVAVALNDRRAYHWDDFRSRLIDEIATAEACGAESTYYERWLTAFEKLLVERGLVSPAELEARTAEYARGERTDEDHDHDEDHAEHG
jgi:nitrile hydratase accessory protein